MFRVRSAYRCGLTRLTVCLAAATMISIAGEAVANDEVPHEARGHERSGYSLSDYENINLANGNLTFRVPLAAVRTDGGLSWELALHHNSKVWFTHRYCSLTPSGYDSCQAAGGYMLDATVAHGIDAFGFGWDLRPPRILPRRTFPFSRETAYVDASGARHGLNGSPAWDLGEPPGAGEGPDWSVGDHLYSRDGSNLRFTVDEVDAEGRALRIEMENGSGDLYVFAHVVAASCDATELLTPGDLDLAPFNFRVDVSGLYLTEIQRGPWRSDGPANRITFDYAATSSWEADCDGSGPRPWLPSRVTASGEVPRTVEVEYDPATWTARRVTAPSFNPVIGDSQSSTEREEILLSMNLRSFDQRNGAHPCSFDAAHLTEVRYPDGTAFRFDELLPPGGAPLSDVVLPSGGRVEYAQGPYPVGRGRCEDDLDDGDECTFWLTCGVSVPRIGDETSRSLSSDGVAYRSISYRDGATEPGTERRQSTWFMQGLNCAVSPSFTRPPGVLHPWPYDFDWALRDDGGLQHPEYLWTVVYTSGGLGGPGSQGVAEIHRFHPLTREEFSIDLVAGDSDALAELPMMALVGVEDLTGPQLRVLRHTEIERELKFGQNYPSVTQGEDRYTYVRERRIFTDEESGDAGAADVENCHPPVFADPLGPPSVAVECTEVRETTEVDDYLNPVMRSLESLRSAAAVEVSRTWEHEYLDQDAEPTWWLHREVGHAVCDSGASCSRASRAWVDLSQPGSRSWFAPAEEITNPGAGGGCSADCIRQAYGYDSLGNRELTTVTGGYGLGFGDLALATRTEHRHGRPVRRVLEGGGESLLSWQREVDPGTGLVRWHLAGNGVGFAYGYDGVGRTIDIVPIEGDFVGVGWTLEIQRATDGGEMLGRHLDRVLPTPSALLSHEVRDAVFRLDEVAGGRRLQRSWLDPEPFVRVAFDGLGRASRWSDRYPSGSGSRSRVALDLLRDGIDPCGTGQGSGLDHTTRVTLASEWRDDAEWSTCGDLDWTETRYDPLGRPAIVRLPDGSESFLGYVGDSQRTVVRSVATDPAGGQQWLAAVRLEDALGRLRALDEELSPGVVYTADYQYDHEDRLIAAHLWQGAPGSSPDQTRRWSYSDGGFLTSSVEPELNTSYLSWDALGNVRRSFAGPTRLDADHDALGRKIGIRVDGVVSASWLWGDTRPVGPAEVGEPDYGKVVEAEQHNRFGVHDVAVRSTWSFGGPGGRVDGRNTAIGGIGSVGDRFAVGYGYDRWGNVARVDHPSWLSWPSGCQEPVREEHASQGEWLLASDALVDGLAIPIAGAECEYHANGRVAETAYEAGGLTVGRLVEQADPSGMPRPRELELWWSDDPGESMLRWVEGPFDYDGAGNVSRIGDRRFIYDGLDRLTAFHEGGLPVEAYTWDRWGNLAEIANTDWSHGGGFTIRLLGAADDNRPETLSVVGLATGSLAWNGRGSLASIPAVGQLRGKRLVYSGEERLLEAEDQATGTTWRYAYDAAGERVASWRRDGGGGLAEVRLHLRDESGAVLSDWTLLPASEFGPTRDYVRTGDSVVAQLDWTDGVLSPHYLAHDHLGSTRVVIELDGTMTDLLEYYPFGGLRIGGPAPGTSHLFTGHERDLGATSSELDYMHARYYTPALGRFTSLDAVGGDPSSSQSWNRYSYTRNNPLRAVDPNGLWAEDFHRNLTQYLARAAGYSKDDAKTIAESNQSVDEGTPALPWKTRDWRRHFTSHEAAGDRFAAAFASNLQPEERLASMGRALHSVQDAHAHAGYWWPDGHGLAGKGPDTPWLHPNEAMAAAEETFELLGGDPAMLDRRFLQMIFSVHSQTLRAYLADLGQRLLNGSPGMQYEIVVDNQHDCHVVSEYFMSQGYQVRIDGFAQ